MASQTPNPVLIQLPATVARDERIVGEGFWKKLLKVVGKIPFAEEAAAAYFCALDSNTPSRVKAILLAALAYFCIPFDVVPDFVAGLGFTDDAAVLAMALTVVAGQLNDDHRRRARTALQINDPQA